MTWWLRARRRRPAAAAAAGSVLGEWLRVNSKPPREIRVENDCTGSSECAVVIHIRERGGGGRMQWLDAHLNEEEGERIRAAIAEALNEHGRRRGE